MQKPKLATQNTVIALDQNCFKSFAVENSEGDRRLKKRSVFTSTIRWDSEQNALDLIPKGRSYSH